MLRRSLSPVLTVAGSALAVWLCTIWVPGIEIPADASTTSKVITVTLIALIIGAVNLVVKPLAKMILFAPYLLTLGLIAIVVNGLLLLLVELIANWLDIPFTVENFWPAGVLGALFISVVSWALQKVSDMITNGG